PGLHFYRLVARRRECNEFRTRRHSGIAERGCDSRVHGPFGHMPPEFGHTPNMVVASLKSGTNRFHGTVFEFLRNDKFDARNFFLARREPLKRNQAGATVGGPVKKDRVFFFADFQATRLRQGTTFNYVVPSLTERSGDFSDILPRTIVDPLTRQPFPGNIIPANRLSPQGTWFVPYIPTPNLLQGTTS